MRYTGHNLFNFEYNDRKWYFFILCFYKQHHIYILIRLNICIFIYLFPNFVKFYLCALTLHLIGIFLHCKKMLIWYKELRFNHGLTKSHCTIISSDKLMFIVIIPVTTVHFSIIKMRCHLLRFTIIQLVLLFFSYLFAFWWLFYTYI